MAALYEGRFAAFPFVYPEPYNTLKHVWFERSELRDRKAVGRKLSEHTKDNKNYPCLIFPEGTCINNTSVMQFKKGSFEASDIIYPGMTHTSKGRAAAL